MSVVENGREIRVQMEQPEETTALLPSIIALKDEQFDLLMQRLSQSKPKENTSNPAGLGLAAFALTTFMLSVFNAGSNLIDHHLEPVVLPVALFYGGLAQFAAGMWEFQLSNTFGATAFTSYGAFWMSFAGYVHIVAPQIAPLGKTHQATGLFLLSWFIFTLYMNVAAWRISRILFAVFTTLNFAFFFLIVGSLAKITVLTNIGGWIGIITALLAWYASAAVLINSAYQRPLLPVGHYKKKEGTKSAGRATTDIKGH